MGGWVGDWWIVWQLFVVDMVLVGDFGFCVVVYGCFFFFMEVLMKVYLVFVLI